MRSGPTLYQRLIPLDSERATLTTGGGKATNLARLARSGLPVPAGFIITTDAYEEFVASHGIGPQLDDVLARLPAEGDPAAHILEEISRTVSRLFHAPTFDEALKAEIVRAYGNLGRPPVAVRSSATTEDLPDLSFAGQQESFLNVVGDDQLLDAIVGCWTSLWTPRAIGYRARNQIPAGRIAVVVQRMVESEAAGVMFTAHPVTGNRCQIVIEATRGLGESLVSGQVEPDRFTVDAESRRIVECHIGAKQIEIHSSEGGGTRTVPGPLDGSSAPSITDDQIGALVRLGARAAELYGAPQDIEWALSDGSIYLLQSRAITSLFPIPTDMHQRPLQVMMSFAAIQGLMDPFTPAGADMIRQIFASASHIFGYRSTRETQRVIAASGGRLWVNVTALLRTSLGRKVAPRVLAFLEPTVAQALGAVWEDPEIQPIRPNLRAGAVFRLLRFFGPLAGNVALNMLSPRLRREALVQRGERILDRLRSAPEPPGEALERLAAFAGSVERTFDTLIPPTFVRLVSGVATGMISLHLLNMTARRSGAAGAPNATPIADLVLEVTRGVSNNPTTEMDLALWDIAMTYRRNEEREPTARATQVDTAAQPGNGPVDATQLAEEYEAGRLSYPVQSAISGFLERYGARGLAELDLGRPRWREEPQHLFEMLEGYRKIRDPQMAPDAVFARSAAKALDAVERLAAVARASAPGLLGLSRAARVRVAAKRARTFLGFREYPKFFAVRMMDLFRTRLLSIGGKLASSGLLARPDDLFFLTLAELDALGHRQLTVEAARSTVESRRAEYRRELLRHRIPRLLLSDGRAFYGGIASQRKSRRKGVERSPVSPPDATAPSDKGTAGDVLLSGSPVSPGSVEGRVRVVLDPRSSGLEPGEIMVCRGTDPSWTPLFLIAAGLVMEVGGMMTHGAVVAREYGIPAVVGVHEAADRLTNGQRILIDGSTGTITLLDPRPEPGSGAGR